MINLFDKRINGFLTKMDDSTSMVSLALRDSVESSGRTYMEYKRDPHGGRERLIEEVATTVIWGFGINWMKKFYDYLAKDVMKAIALPDMDIALLKKTEAPPANQSWLKTHFNPPSAQSLVNTKGHLSDRIGKFTEAVHKHSGQRIYDNLLDVIGNQSKKARYNRSNLLKFGFATLIPVVGIAVGIPTFNQWLTRKKLEKTGQARPQQTPQQTPQPLQGWNTHKNAAPGFNRSPVQPAAVAAPYPMAAGTFSAPLSANGPSGAAFNGPAPVNNPFGLATASATTAFGQLPPARPGLSGTAPTAVRFGGLLDAPGNLAAALLQNERANTLLVDQTISGGRVIKARNWQERLEIAFREVSIIACLYWGQQALQSFFINKLGKNSHSQLSFDVTKHLRDKFLLPNGPLTAQHFADQYRNHLDDLAKAMDLGDHKTLLNTLKNASNPQAQYQLDQQFTEAVLKHFEQKKPTPNLFLDLAKECHWIPTFDGQASSSARRQNAVKKWVQDAGQNVKTVFSKAPEQYAPQAGKFLDLTKKINSEAMFGFIQSMEKAFVSEGLEQAPQKLEKVLQKSIRGRAGAWLASNAVCTLLLSYIIPKAQHYMTYRMTGKNYFPGVEKNA
ncbi:hypothetical protein [Vampirovibrio chlorellavorus]|uniref:hypothetical protein n=1 Tax=Vampirovibrio chlorellavorus TaxID=758823 RepID=UPI0026EA0D1E|nr:hypothetical protein [Vampirovibrio chlorellavorus]